MLLQMDAHYVSTKATYVRPRHYRERLFPTATMMLR
jgi:hypothetical protein